MIKSVFYVICALAGFCTGIGLAVIMDIYIFRSGEKVVTPESAKDPNEVCIIGTDVRVYQTDATEITVQVPSCDRKFIHSWVADFTLYPLSHEDFIYQEEEIIQYDL